jgi:hypothetical protein
MDAMTITITIGSQGGVRGDAQPKGESAGVLAEQVAELLRPVLEQHRGSLFRFSGEAPISQQLKDFAAEMRRAATGLENLGRDLENGS